MTVSKNERSPELSMAAERAEHFIVLEGYQPTDMQYSIGRIEGGERRGFDLIHPQTKDRVYVTGPSDEHAEQLIRDVLGPNSVLRSIDRNLDFNVYHVPRAARLLEKTLEQGPYNPAYMRRLASRSFRFIETLNRLDTQAFGLDSSSIALTHNGEDDQDDVHLTVVPPLRPATHAPNVRDKDYYSDLAAVRRILAAQNAGTVAMRRLNNMNRTGQKYLNTFDVSSILKYFKTDEESDRK